MLLVWLLENLLKIAASCSSMICSMDLADLGWFATTVRTGSTVLFVISGLSSSFVAIRMAVSKSLVSVAFSRSTNSLRIPAWKNCKQFLLIFFLSVSPIWQIYRRILAANTLTGSFVSCFSS